MRTHVPLISGQASAVPLRGSPAGTAVPWLRSSLQAAAACAETLFELAAYEARRERASAFRDDSFDVALLLGVVSITKDVAAVLGEARGRGHTDWACSTIAPRRLASLHAGGRESPLVRLRSREPSKRRDGTGGASGGSEGPAAGVVGRSCRRNGCRDRQRSARRRRRKWLRPSRQDESHRACCIAVRDERATSGRWRPGRESVNNPTPSASALNRASPSARSRCNTGRVAACIRTAGARSTIAPVPSCEQCGLTPRPAPPVRPVRPEPPVMLVDVRAPAGGRVMSGAFWAEAATRCRVSRCSSESMSTTGRTRTTPG